MLVLRSYFRAVDNVREAQLGRGGARREAGPDALREAIEAERTAQRNLAAALPRALAVAGVEPRPALVSAALDVVRAAARRDDAREALEAGRLLEPPEAAADPFAALLGGIEPTAAERAFLQRDPACVPAGVDQEALRRNEIARLDAEAEKSQRAAEAAEAAAEKARAAAGEAEARAERARAAADAAAREARRAFELAEVAKERARRALAAAKDAAARVRAREERG